MGKKVVAKILVVVMLAVTIVANMPEKDAKAALNAYYFGNLTYVSQWGVSSRSVTDGALKVTFNSKYGEVKYSLPNAISLSSIETITIGAGTGGQDTAFKFYDAGGKELFVKYNANNWDYDDFEITKSGSGSIKTIGVMSQSSSTYTATIYNVRITTSSGSSGSGSTGGTVTAGTLKGAMSGTFGKVGNAVNLSDLRNANTLNIIKNDFNSITMENEMKPDAVLGSKVTMITKEEAQKLGYIIPDNYKETSVPKLNFDRIDKILQTAYDNGLGLRGHTLLWHSQTPAWFFGIDYDADEDAVDEDTMDARIDFYVSTVMDHVMQKEKEIAGETGKIVYAWDVVNEYLHRGRAWSLNWTSVYGDMKGTPSYVKRAFERAYEMLEKYDATDKVTLFYNDYDTYFEVEDLLALVNFINEGEKAKICSGIGMQSHVDVKRPTIEEYGAALEKFMAAGYEVQITELDFTINFNTDGSNPSYEYKNEGETIEEQAAFVKDFMEMVIAKQKNRDKTVSPKGITGLTIWGLYDSISWRGKSQPLLFGTSIDDPKPAFQAFLEASRTK